jgi:superfamily I DNA and/or RNA helicase
MNHVQVNTAYSQRVGTSRQNENEAEAIVEWIAEKFPVILERYKFKAENKQEEFNSKLVLGIITPFKSQSRLIKRLISKKLPDYSNDISVGTVHTFQGAERNIIIFSSVYGNQEGCSFINRNTNLMNVAVSRAKDAFMVFGDIGCLKGSSNSAAGMLKEICQEGML